MYLTREVGDGLAREVMHSSATLIMYLPESSLPCVLFTERHRDGIWTYCRLLMKVQSLIQAAIPVDSNAMKQASSEEGRGPF